MRNILFSLVAMIGMLASLGSTTLWAGNTDRSVHTLTVNDGTTTSSYLPFYSLYSDYGSKSQFVIPASSLTSVPVGNPILGLKFYTNGSASATWNETFTVALNEVEQTSFQTSDGYADMGTAVYTGNLTTVSGIMTITFDAEYTYNGGNLLVTIQTPGLNSGYCTSTYFYGVSSSNVGLYGYNSYGSSNQYNTPPTAPNGVVSVAPKTTIMYEAPGDPEEPEPEDPDTPLECVMEDFTSTSATSATTAGYLPTGWTGFAPGGTAAYAAHVSSSSFSSMNDGNYAILVTSSSSPNSYMVLPKYEDVTAVSFDYRYESTSYGTLSVGYVTENTEAGCANYVVLASLTATTTKTHVALTDAQIEQINDNDAYIAFRYNNTQSSVWYTAGIDNVEVCVDLCGTSSTDEYEMCDTELPFTWIDGNQYTESNNSATFILPNAEGCDSTITLNLIVNPSIDTIYNVTTCNPYNWYDSTYIDSGTFTYDGETEHGCEIHAVLNLNIVEHLLANVYETACDSFPWIDGDGETYYQTGVYEYIINTEDCDSIVYLNLTVNYSEMPDAEIVTACENYEWHDTTYAESGIYTYITELETGCTKTETLELTILHNEFPDAEVVGICESYDWYGTTYTESGTYTYESQLEAGCTKTETLELTIYHDEDIEPVEIVACETYEWYDMTYTTSGTYTHQTEHPGGCITNETIELTIVQPVANEISLTTCYAYNWNNIYYDESGDYTQIFVAANGCDSVVTLHLTMNNNIGSEFEAEACEHYIWNTVKYGNSGDYTQTFASVTGCDSTVTLHLIIKDPVSFEFDAEECPGYAWNDMTYTESGDYEQIFTAANGCDSIVTMHLTVKDTPYYEFEAETCGSYEWEGEQYTNSGSYPHTYTAANGCDSTVMLMLTINNLPNVTITGDLWVAEGVQDTTTLTAWGGVSYLWSTGDTTQSVTVTLNSDLTLSVEVTSEKGCTSIAEVTVTNTTGITETQQNLSVYPNPVTNVVNIKADNISNVRICDILGQVIYEQNLNADQFQIDMSGYARGNYILMLTTPNGIATHKILKK